MLEEFEFETSRQVIDDFRSRLTSGKFRAALTEPKGPQLALAASLDYQVLQRLDAFYLYKLAVTLSNTGEIPIDDYWVELLFPKALMDTHTINAAEQKDRATETHRFFRQTGQRRLYPGDTIQALTVEYHMDTDLHRALDVQESRVDVRAFANGEALSHIQRLVRELHKF